MKICCIADTHQLHHLLDIPECDVLVCAGDYDLSVEWDMDRLNYWFGTLKDKVGKIVFIAGNHDFALQKSNSILIEHVFTNAIYLEDSSVTIDGVKFYGTPWCPMFHSWAFMETHDFLKENREKIPEDTDVLISHCPPFGIMDHVKRANGDSGQSQGCASLRNRIKLIKPKLSVFGHIHEGRGQYTDYTTDYVNASIMDEMYSPVNSPILTTI